MVCVHPDSLRQGVGRGLVREIVQMSDDWLNLKLLELKVWTDNTAAIALFKVAAFTVEGTLKAYAWRKGVYFDAFAMARIV